MRLTMPTWPLVVLASLALAACATTGTNSGGSSRGGLSGIAAWYGAQYAGRPTASGAIFDPGKLTAAHRTLPFGTRVRVTNRDNGRSVTVTINDRGPFTPGRVIDLSEAAARKIDMIRAGIAPVEIEVLD